MEKLELERKMRVIDVVDEITMLVSSLNRQLGREDKKAMHAISMEISIKISTLIQLLNNKNKKEDERV